VVTVHTDDVQCQAAVGIMDANGALDMDSHRDKPDDRGEDSIEGATDTRRNDTHRGHSSQRNPQNAGADNESMALDENARRLEPWAKHGAILGANINPDAFDDDFHMDYQNRYAGTGVGFDRYQPAYALGAQYARDSRFLDRDWYASEAEMRREWESARHGGAWDDFKHAVRHGWERVRGRG
jgi:hypothetical protein